MQKRPPSLLRPRSAIARNARCAAAVVSLASSLCLTASCETDRKFVSGTSAAGPTATLPEAGVDPAPDIDSLPLCPAGASCEDSGCTDDSQCAAPTRCDRESRRCIGCQSNADCPNEGGLCRTSDGACVECLTNRECAGDFGASRCGADGKCAPCSNDDDCSLVGNGLNTCLLLTGGNNRCVQCITNDECADGTVCNTDDEVYECVECSSNGDCTDPGASRCEENVCVPCQGNADCAQLPGLGVCDLSGALDGSGAECVQCTGLQRDACANGMNVCNGRTRQCTNSAVGSVTQRCAPCVSDAQCASDARCGQQRLGGADFFCFPVPGPTCTIAPFSVLSFGTIDSVAEPICTPRRTTCAALIDLGRQSCAQDSDCGEENIDDGVCASIADQGQLCSLPCTGASDCNGSLCVGGACEL